MKKSPLTSATSRVDPIQETWLTLHVEPTTQDTSLLLGALPQYVYPNAPSEQLPGADSNQFATERVQLDQRQKNWASPSKQFAL